MICSFLPCLSWLLRSRVRKSRRDLRITLYTIILRMHKRKKRFCHYHKFNAFITQFALQFCTKHLASTHVFENQQFPITSAQQRQQVDAVGCRAFSDGLIRVFASNILQIPSSAPPILPTGVYFYRHFLFLNLTHSVSFVVSPITGASPGSTPAFTEHCTTAALFRSVIQEKIRNTV